MIQQIVEFIVKELVEFPSSVRVALEKENQKIIITIHVDERDFGKVIGKGGQTIRSIRSIASVLNKEGGQVFVDVAK